MLALQYAKLSPDRRREALMNLGYKLYEGLYFKLH